MSYDDDLPGLSERHDAASGLLPAHFDDDQAVAGQKRLRKVLRALGARVAGKPAGSPTGPTYSLVIHTSDHNYESTLYAVPDEAVTPALRAALQVAPDCFAAPDDAYLKCWGDILRLLAVWGLAGLTAAQFHDVMVEDFGAGHGHTDLPDLDELTALAGAWAPYVVASLDQAGTTAVDGAAPWLSYRYRSMHLFRQSM
ncbi:hypothetical protein GCM10010399_60680 [Dactylosporangium fulvum]|uniref:Uncharacterized protein n=1 Tax=Dactylosporangium fulvum TaxID=53359 RepID=A0ABY5W2A2_9ACTN|nr:hypothetical protein [Dactylosporangium fulvum]UWP83236.1 hypothetical protein Dfulv_02715 [Dactylosporangium fulvum]